MELPLVFGIVTVVVGLMAVGYWAVRSGAPTQSIAEVLHDAETAAPDRRVS